jgi:hypothetical protein
MSPNTETPADINLLNTRYEPDMQKALLEMQNKKQSICFADEPEFDEPEFTHDEPEFTHDEPEFDGS